MDKEDDDTQNALLVDITLQEHIQLAQQLLTDLIQSEGIETQSIFNSEHIPSISLEAYLRRIHKYTQYSPQCLILAIIYLDRYNMEMPQFSLNWHNVHRIFLACLILAVKFNDDIYFDNCAFEKSGGVSTSQLLQFQLELFQKLQYSVYVQDTEYEALREKLYSVYGDE